MEDHLRTDRQSLQKLREQRSHAEVERAKNDSDRQLIDFEEIEHVCPPLRREVQRRFGLTPQLTAYGAECYFDPGFREQAQIEKLVASWQRDGIRSIYAAAWHFGNGLLVRYPTAT